MSREPLIRVSDLTMHFRQYQGVIVRRLAHVTKAVDGVSFDIFPSETLGLVGESGCGKSTTGRCILQLHRPTSGEVLYKGQDLCKLSNRQMRPHRRDLQIIFQDPYSSLNPRMTIGSIIAEPLVTHHICPKVEIEERVKWLMNVVGLDPTFILRYAHEFSGGQRQRIGIARALALNPKFIVADEPISALDVSIQAQIMNLLCDLQEKFELTYLFIAHDLSAVKHISNRVAVMYLGRIVEIAPVDAIFEEPLHPYSQALISAVPVANPKIEARRKRIVLEGDVPSPSNPPSGCRFHTRCRHANKRCKTESPELTDAGGGHFVSCHMLDEGRIHDGLDEWRTMTRIPSIISGVDLDEPVAADGRPTTASVVGPRTGSLFDRDEPAPSIDSSEMT
ncbi:MAG: ATP-binding cassette domain-containing protein [Myxococcales bacterium]|nr:ATP-binding cassette domain-containing protein [Myxococcales bacterium]